MLEKRKFHRVRLAANCMQSHHESIYRGQLENISLNGALVRFEQGISVPQGVEYNLTVEIEGEAAPLQFIVEVACATYTLTGIKFVSYEADTGTRLGQLLEKLSAEPERLRTELVRFRKHLDDYLH